MAIGVVKLTKRGRMRLAIAFIVLNTIQALFGLCITIWSIYICISISPNLSSEKAEVVFVFTVTGMYGTHIIFHYLIGIKICQKCYLKAHKKSTRCLLFLWYLAGCNTNLNIFLLAIMAVKISKHIVRSMRHSLEKGTQNYLKDPVWKHTIDGLQIKMKCCGIRSYKDWYDFAWIDKYHVNEDSDLIKELRTSEELLHLPITPWSCCRLDFPMQCLHDPLQQIQSKHLWQDQPNLILESINTNGCLTRLRKPIESGLIGFILITVFILIIQFVIIGISRIMYISSRNAAILGFPDGIAPGWIFGRGDCGYKKGRTLEEMMADVEQVESPEPSEPDTGRSSLKQRLRFKMPKMPKFPKLKSKASSDHDPVSSGDEEALMLK